MINCRNDKDEIEAALIEALSDRFMKKAAQVRNPYEGERTSDQMISIIQQALEQGIDKKKTFYDIGGKQ